LYQSITGAGQVVPPEVSGGYTIPAGLNFNFRVDSARIILLWTDERFHSPTDTPGYPGPTMEEVIAAATGLTRRVRRKERTLDLASDAVRVIGIVSIGLKTHIFSFYQTKIFAYYNFVIQSRIIKVSQVSPTYIPQLAQLANATGAVAGPGGIDCNGDGYVDITEGQPIVCSVSAGLTQAVLNVVEAIVPTIPAPAPTKKKCKRCTKVLGIQICPRNRCGILGRLVGLCKKCS
jgi:hypothetical protein